MSLAQELEPTTIAAAQRGEVAAQEQLYRCYAERVYSLAYRLMGQAADAQDLVQESFIRCFDALGQYRGEAPLWAWLKQITIRLALSRLRSQRRWHWVSFDHWNFGAQDDAGGLADTLADPLNLSDQTQQHLDLARALEQLNGTARAVLYLYHAEGYNHAEIAALWGKSVSFSKSQLARAHQRLREILLVQETPTQAAATRNTLAANPSNVAPSLGLVKELCS